MSRGDPIRAVRRIRRDRSGAASRDDLAYASYMIVLLILIVAAPLVRAVALQLAEPAAADALSDSGAPVAGLVLGALAAASVLLGGVRGPALLSPFLTVAVAGNGLPRRRTLRAPVVCAFVALVLLFGGVAALLGLVLASTGRASLAAAVVFIVAGLLAGAIGGGCWLLGQWLGPLGRGVLTVALLASTVLSMLAPVVAVATPWGWFAALFPGGTGAVASSPTTPGDAAGLGGVAAAPIPWLAALPALGALSVVAAALLAITPVLLDRLSGPALLAQAQRWQTAGTLAFTGDLATALGEFRAVPRRGRRLRAIGGRALPLPLLFLRRDLVGSLRTPARFAAAALGTAGAGYLLVVALHSPDDVAWIVSTGAAVLGFLALGVWADGFRHVAEAAGAPPLYGLSPSRLLALHSALPVLAGVVFAIVGAGVGAAAAVARADVGGAPASGSVVGAGAGAGAGALAVALAATAALLLVAVRLYDSTKGPLPLALLAPVPSPFGDLSALVVATWQADALIIAAIALIALTWAVGGAGLLGLLVAVPFLAALLLFARRRLRAG